MTTVPPAKRPYVAPLVRTYGSLTQLTNAVGNSSMNTDGATMGNSKTK